MPAREREYEGNYTDPRTGEATDISVEYTVTSWGSPWNRTDGGDSPEFEINKIALKNDDGEYGAVDSVTFDKIQADDALLTKIVDQIVDASQEDDE
jgi:hypothetical protein